MKAAGFALILLAALLSALQRIGAARARAETLGDFCRMLEEFTALLESEAPPMPELIEKLTLRAEGRGARFLQSLGGELDRLGEKRFRELWCASLDGIPELTEGARRELETLGAVLGLYTLETQGEALRACLAALRGEKERLERELPQVRRLSLGLSLSAALLGILLI